MPTKAIVKHHADFTAVKHEFGEVREISKTDVINAAIAVITDDLKHYHKTATEFYYVLSGTGTIELDDETHYISDGTSIIIPPYTWHRVKANEGSKFHILVISSPPFGPNDVFYD